MARRRPTDQSTMDLFSWTPPALAKTFEPSEVRAASLRSSIAKAVSLALKACGKSRDQAASEVGAYLGEDCPKNMLDAYASEAREEHSINLVRFVALIHTTRDMRLLNLVANMFGQVVIDQKYLPAIEEAICQDKIEELQARKAQARKSWKGGL